MTAPHPHAPFISGLSEIAARYPAIICDVWGVLHNGAVATPGAAEALARYRAAGGRVVLLTNAPRPGDVVRQQLLKTYGVTAASYDAIVSSGDVTTALLKSHAGQSAFHIGPDRDLNLYDGTGLTLGGEAAADLVVCTGLTDDDVEQPEDYRPQLARLAARGLTFICANPDVVVERGGRLIPCAGGVARVYEDLGGQVISIGKPHRPVYDAARATLNGLAGRTLERHEMLAIGDAMLTDVSGARNEGIDLLYITQGIHAHEFGPPEAPDAMKVGEMLASHGAKARAVLPTLRW